jgi:hypothetical protein
MTCHWQGFAHDEDWNAHINEVRSLFNFLLVHVLRPIPKVIAQEKAHPMFANDINSDTSLSRPVDTPALT